MIRELIHMSLYMEDHLLKMINLLHESLNLKKLVLHFQKQKQIIINNNNNNNKPKILTLNLSLLCRTVSSNVDALSELYY